MNASPLTPRERKRLKGATRALVERAGGPTEAATGTRVAASLLSRYGSEAAEHETTFAPADVVKELELAAGEPMVTRALADMQGYDLAPRRGAGAPADYARHDTALTRASCALLVAFREAQSDHRLSADELVQLETLAGTLSAEIAAFRSDAARDLAPGHPAPDRAAVPFRRPA